VKQSVLVVDDDVDLREGLAELLQDHGYSAVCAADGAQALEIARDLHPCVILLDMMMPVMDGWAFLAEKKADPSIASIPTLIISAVPQRVLPRADGCIPKPVDVPALLREVGKHCEHITPPGQ
jgi:CheY-like chemotaxis protein